MQRGQRSKVALPWWLLGVVRGSWGGSRLLKVAKKAEDEQKAIAALLKTPGLVPLLRGDPFAAQKGAPSPARIDTTARNWLRRLTPIE